MLISLRNVKGPAKPLPPNGRDQARHFLLRSPGAWLPIIAGIGVLILSDFLSDLPSNRNPVLFGQLQFTCGILAITFAGTAFVRFGGTRDRLPLILAADFVIVGVIVYPANPIRDERP